MSDGLLRISEAVAVDCAHISTEADGTGRLLIPSSKTDQTGQGAVVFLSKATLAAVEQYRQLAGILDGPLFRRIRRGDHITEHRMTAHGARLTIQARAKAVGIDGASGQSLRVGTTQDLTAAGFGLAELQNAGRWRSPDMPGRYSRGQAAGRGRGRPPQRIHRRLNAEPSGASEDALPLHSCVAVPPILILFRRCHDERGENTKTFLREER